MNGTFRFPSQVKLGAWSVHLPASRRSTTAVAASCWLLATHPYTTRRHAMDPSVRQMYCLAVCSANFRARAALSATTLLLLVLLGVA